MKQVAVIANLKAARAVVVPDVRTADTKAKTGAANPLQGFVDSFDTAEQQVQKKMVMFRDAILAGLVLTPEQGQRIFDSINSIFTEGIEEIPQRFGKKFAEQENPFKPMIAAAEQAAQSTQTAFADFFFDPFEDGLRGLLNNFIQAMRRMFAEALAFKTLGLFGGSSFFSRVLGIPGRAAGGISSGLTMVGEQGRELVQLPRGSRVLNNSTTESMLRGGEPQFITNIDARGADPGLIARLPQYLEQRDKQLMLAVPI
jgi:hypothetical protein